MGNAEDDILIAGATTYDDSNPANYTALLMIMDEWTRYDRDYQQRIDNLENGTGLNGPFRLDNTTVFHDLDDDKLTGSSGLDWFLFDLDNDRATDLHDEVFTADLEWILAE